MAISSLLYILTLHNKHNVLASLHELTLYKTHYRRVGSFARSQSQHMYLFQKVFWLETLPIINRLEFGIRMSWVEKKITQEVAFQNLSVRLLSIIFQSSFGSAEFGKRFMQFAKEKHFYKISKPSRSILLYPKQPVGDIDLHI